MHDILAPDFVKVLNNKVFVCLFVKQNMNASTACPYLHESP